MKDGFLFGLLPYAALLLFVIGVAVRMGFAPRSSSGSLDARPSWRGLPWRSWSWRVGLVGVLLGHLAGFLFPGALASIHQHPRFLSMMEAAGVIFGTLAVVGLLVEVFHDDGGLRPRSLLDTVGLTLVGVALVSGLAMILAYRGAPSWYGPVLVPYLQSILVFEPRLGLMGPLPFWVRLHVLTAFLLLAVAPWTSLGGWVARRGRFGSLRAAQDVA